MKNFLLGAALVISIVALIAGFASLSGLDRVKKKALDEKAVIQLVQSQSNPEFTSVDQVLVFRSQLSKNTENDSMFIAMGEKTLIDVSSVVINKNKRATQADIINEFKSHPDVYNNLHPTPGTPSRGNNTTSPSIGPDNDEVQVLDPPNTTTEIHYTDTIIDGIKRKVKVVKQMSYE